MFWRRPVVIKVMLSPAVRSVWPARSLHSSISPQDSPYTKYYTQCTHRTQYNQLLSRTIAISPCLKLDKIPHWNAHCTRCIWSQRVGVELWPLVAIRDPTMIPCCRLIYHQHIHSAHFSWGWVGHQWLSGIQPPLWLTLPQAPPAATLKWTRPPYYRISILRPH